MRLGHIGLFLAPHLEAQAVNDLSRFIDVPAFCVISASDENPCQSSEGTKVPDIAYVQHTSGTSSGFPKPISQTQWGAVGCLPVFVDVDPPATFTTTPFYHGGVADALRAWASGAGIWFFPEDRLPITCVNICRALTFSQEKTKQVSIQYFSCVPYVLELLVESEDSKGIEVLRSLTLVGVGGAPLQSSTEKKLVSFGVKLLSRMGSAECGFLMSSARQFDTDDGWEYFRPTEDSTKLHFEARGEGLSELLVKSGWPLRLKMNREDGSYATADLFEQHPTIPSAWRYRGRLDGLITLANGKKFDRSPLEDDLRASCDVLQDVLICGTGRHYPGALLFAVRKTASDEEVLDRIRPHL
ncbi:hypothetical protein F5Y16DRAFT_424253 [Xylariaceae sp. FL0255]|nr:hypothetical protein F5Y16DRAFT_424253 [Xylariaceae sp. FL0255]